MSENVDTHTYGDKRVVHFIRYHFKRIINSFFIDETMTVQAQMLKIILISKKLKEATTLLGIRKSTKDKKK